MTMARREHVRSEHQADPLASPYQKLYGPAQRPRRHAWRMWVAFGALFGVAVAGYVFLVFALDWLKG